MPRRGAMHPRPSDWSVGVCTATCRHTFPSVSLPPSPYVPASGRAPIPAPSSTSTIAREKGGGGTPVARCASALRGQVVPCRSRAPDARDGVFEQHLVGTGLIDDEREAVEVPDPSLDLLTVHQADRHDKPFPPGEVEEGVLNVRLRGVWSCFGGVRHQPCGSRSAVSARTARSMTAGSSPGPSSQTRLGSLRNQINCRRAYRRFSCAMSARVAASSRSPCRNSIACRYTSPPNGRALSGTPRASRSRISFISPRSNCASTLAVTRADVSAAGIRSAIGTTSQKSVGESVSAKCADNGRPVTKYT